MVNKATSPIGMRIELRRRDGRFAEFRSASIVFIILPSCSAIPPARLSTRAGGNVFLPPKSGTTAWNPPRFARSFLKRPAPNGKTPSKSRGTNVLTLLSDSEGVSCPGDCLPSAVAPHVHVHSSKVINEWYFASRSLGNQKSRDKYPRCTLSHIEHFHIAAPHLPCLAPRV
jgi:hypothetical protein